MEKTNTKVPKDYEQIESNLNFWNPETIDETLSGKVVDYFEMKDQPRRPIIVDETNTEWVTPSHAVALTLLKRVGIGDEIILQYDGEKENPQKGKNPTKQYTLFRKKTE